MPSDAPADGPELDLVDLGLPAPLLEAVLDLGFTRPTPIQAAAIPPLLAGRDLTGVAQTGTGKTAAFGLPLLAAVDTSVRGVQAIVLTPTRELAMQVAEAIESFARRLPGLEVVAVYGGAPYLPQQRALAAKWLAFVNSDLHPAFHPLFGPARFIGDETQFDAVKDAARKRLRGLFETAERQLEGRDWLAGFRSYADPYFYITLRWADRMGVDLSGLPNIAAFRQRMEADAGVQAALKAEGLA